MSVSLRVSVLVVFLVRQRRKHSRLIEALDHPADAVSKFCISPKSAFSSPPDRNMLIILRPFNLCLRRHVMLHACRCAETNGQGRVTHR